MSPSTRKPLSRSARPAGLRQLLFAFLAVLNACAGSGLHSSSRDAAAGGGGAATAGTLGGDMGGGGGSLTTTSPSGGGGTLSGSGGVTSQVGGSGGTNRTSASGGGGWFAGGTSGGSGVATGGVPSFGGSGGAGDGDGGSSAPTDSSCPTGVLWDAITTGAGVIGYCIPIGDGGLPLGGKVVIDSSGRVVDNTRLTGAAKQQWLDGLANQRFSCLAGQTIPYSCVSQ